MSKTTDIMTADTTSLEKLNPAAAAYQSFEQMRPTIIITDDAGRDAIINEVAQAEAVACFLDKKSSVAQQERVNARLRLRRLFPASEAVQAILGPDACDLIGETQAYKDAVKVVNASAHKALVSRFRRDGYDADMSGKMATQMLDSARKNEVLVMRREIEAVMVAACDGDRTTAAVTLLAHGFQHLSSIETKKSPQLIRPGQTLEVIDPQDKQAASAEGVRNVGPSLLRALNPAPVAGAQTPANAPDTDTDTTPPSETADALTANLLKALGEGAATDPNALINQAVGMLRQAQALIAKAPAKVTAKQREAHRKALTSAYRTLMGELEENLQADQAPEATPEKVATKS